MKLFVIINIILWSYNGIFITDFFFKKYKSSIKEKEITQAYLHSLGITDEQIINFNKALKDTIKMGRISIAG